MHFCNIGPVKLNKEKWHKSHLSPFEAVLAYLQLVNMAKVAEISISATLPFNYLSFL